MIDPLVTKMFEDLRDIDPRRVAEVAYALAQMHRRAGNKDQAAGYGRESLRLFDKCRMETLEDCSARYMTLGDIALPDLIHQKVVRNRLQDLDL